MSLVEPIATRLIAVDAICIKQKRLRMFRPEHVDRLAESMQEIGLITPIVVRPKRTGADYWLVSGWHRLKAARLLGWSTISASIFAMNDMQARLAEIDENLVGAHLSPAERAIYADAREALGPWR